jgi:hypothetical protein
MRDLFDDSEEQSELSAPRFQLSHHTLRKEEPKTENEQQIILGFRFSAFVVRFQLFLAPAGAGWLAPHLSGVESPAAIARVSRPRSFTVIDGRIAAGLWIEAVADPVIAFGFVVAIAFLALAGIAAGAFAAMAASLAGIVLTIAYRSAALAALAAFATASFAAILFTCAGARSTLAAAFTAFAFAALALLACLCAGSLAAFSLAALLFTCASAWSAVTLTALAAFLGAVLACTRFIAFFIFATAFAPHGTAGVFTLATLAAGLFLSLVGRRCSLALAGCLAGLPLGRELLRLLALVIVVITATCRCLHEAFAKVMMGVVVLVVFFQMFEEVFQGIFQAAGSMAIAGGCGSA